ncbi:NAD(P)-binding protein [Aureobasidium pullulans]|nr:NAD(P)-binding protein [Aureobasidium pullulans]
MTSRKQIPVPSAPHHTPLATTYPGKTKVGQRSRATSPAKKIKLMTSRASNNIPPSPLKVWKELDNKEKHNNMSGEQKTWTGKAIVARDTLANKGWKIEDVTTREIKDDELLVELVASGICHTDVMCGTGTGNPDLFYYPRVLGHEGSGYVKAVGSKVKVAKPGDAVLLSFDWCGECESCKNGLPSLCYESMPLNFGNKPAFESTNPEDPTVIAGKFFGQSSFSRYSVAKQNSVVNVTDLVESKEELQAFAPLGCGFQTGAGTVINVAKATEKDAIAILGLGGVGLSAIMAAKLSGCRTIIGIDRVDSRMETAKSLGATHVLDTSKLPTGLTVVQAVQNICEGAGPSITIDTTGAPVLVMAGIEMTRKGGKIIQVGSTPPEFQVELPAFLFMNSGKAYMGAIEGNSTSSEFIPKMIQWYWEGKFPFDRFVKLMPAEDFERGIQEMHTGETVKPVITWS